MHTSIPVKNKNEFIKIHYIYHTEVKKTNTQADLFQFRTLQNDKQISYKSLEYQDKEKYKKYLTSLCGNKII